MTDKTADTVITTCGSYITILDNKTCALTRIGNKEYPRFIFVDNGTGSLEINGKQCPFVCHSMIVLKEGVKVKFISKSSKTVVFVCYFSRDLPLLVPEVLNTLFECNSMLTIPADRIEQCRRIIRGLLDEQNHEYPQFQVINRLGTMSMLCTAYRFYLYSKDRSYQDNSDSHTRVRNVLDYIAERYYEDFNLTKVAKMACLSNRQFANICYEECGRNFTEYLNHTRIQRAKDLIMNSEFSITNIAFTVGFEDLSVFYRAFKKFIGAPPQAFRKDNLPQPAKRK